MKYFTITELCTTQTGLPNTPDKEQKQNLERFCTLLLDPLRELYGLPIYVSSAFRTEEVNKAVGGVTNSQHLQGLAADIYSQEESWRLFQTVLNFSYYDQVIWYTEKFFRFFVRREERDFAGNKRFRFRKHLQFVLEYNDLQPIILYEEND